MIGSKSPGKRRNQNKKELKGNDTSVMLGGITMPKGIVKWFDPERGFGFILAEDGTDVFFHQSSIQGGDYIVLDREDRVEFEMAEGEKGKQKAVNVFRTD